MRIKRKAVPATVSTLYRACTHIGQQKRLYLYGGGHSKPLDDITITEGLDCSSSVSLALKRSGMFEHRSAYTAEMFRTWGQPGKGKHFTLWYRGGVKGKAHVWIQFHGIGRFWRFDTSPWADQGGRGPRMRLLPRPTTGFTPRHWPGQ